MNATEVVAGGIRSPVLQAGPQHADEAVVFVHGNPGSGADWADLGERVGAFARVVAPDMPGFGRAGKPRGFPHTVAGHAAHLGLLLDALRVRRAHLVLHDFGGPWGLEWATAHPDRTASITLINTGALLRYRWHRLARIWQTPGLGELFQATATRPAFKLLVNRENPRPFPDAFVDRMYDDYDRATRRAVLELYRATRDPEPVGRRHAAALREQRPPALVVWGAEDPYIPVVMAVRQREALPGARIELLDGLGHWPFVDDPERVAGVVVPWLREQVGT